MNSNKCSIFPERLLVRASDLAPILKWGTKRQNDYRLQIEITEKEGKKSILFSFLGQTLSVTVWSFRYPVYTDMFKEGLFEQITELVVSGPILAQILKTCDDVRMTAKEDGKDFRGIFIETLDSVKGSFIVSGLQE